MKMIHVIAESFLILVVLQALREGMERLILPFLPGTAFAARMTTMAVMLVLTSVTLLYARLRKTPLSVFPQPFGRQYVIFTCIAAVLLISAPSNYTQGCRAILLLVYGCIVTPVFEELVFRGYLWNRLNRALGKEMYTYIWSVALFTVWHLGYMLPHLISGNRTAVLWKLAAGLGYGAVLGFVRMRTKNCYATMLAHGVLNLFMV